MSSSISGCGGWAYLSGLSRAAEQLHLAHGDFAHERQWCDAGLLGQIGERQIVGLAQALHGLAELPREQLRALTAELGALPSRRLLPPRGWP